MGHEYIVITREERFGTPVITEAWLYISRGNNYIDRGNRPIFP